MKTWSPMFMDPIYKETVWGGSKILSVFAKKIPSGHTGESWEVSTHENGESRVRGGRFDGWSLHDVIKEDPEAVLGRSVYQKYGAKLPLLVKIIDAQESLSLQVHPNDEQAAALEGPSGIGKNELWYVIEAESDAQIVYGFQKPFTPEALDLAVEDNNLEDFVHHIPVRRGDAFYIPAGTLHALGEGTMVIEIQQSSDITYRVYDYGRLGLDGAPRQLHLDKAKQVLNFDSSSRIEPKDLSKEGVVTPYFQVYRRNLRGMQEIGVSMDHFQILFILEGSGKIDGVPFKKGDTIFLPAAGETVGLEGRAVYLQIL